MNPSDDNPDPPDAPDAKAVTKCPICRKPVAGDSAGFPFCSPRCRQIDLGRWLSGDYVISRPIEQKDLEDGE